MKVFYQVTTTKKQEIKNNKVIFERNFSFSFFFRKDEGRMNKIDMKPEFRSKENLSNQSLRCKDTFFGVKSRFFDFFVRILTTMLAVIFVQTRFFNRIQLYYYNFFHSRDNNVISKNRINSLIRSFITT